MAETFFDSYGSTGLKEDVLDLLTVISPEDTPVFSMLRETESRGVHHEWLTIALPTSTGNAQTEGFTFSYASGNAEVRLHNYTQIFSKLWKVSGTVEVVDKYGRGSEFDMRKLHAMKALKIDMEWALLDNTASAAGATTATARTMNALRGAAMNGGITSTAHATSTLSAPLDETILNAHLQDMWQQGARPDTLVCGGFVKRTISGFVGAGAGRPIVNQNGDRVASNVIDVYESDFGRLNLIPSRVLNRKSDVLVFQNDLLALAWLRRPFTADPPRDGDYMPGAVIGECTFEYLNPLGVGRISRVQSA